jgi:verruculogen synthase
MAISTDNSHPDSALQSVDITTPPDEVVRILREYGTVTVKNFIPPDVVDKLQAEIDPTIAAFPLGPNHEGEIYKATIGARTKQVANLVTVSETFRHKILNHRWMHAVTDGIFRPDWGDYWMNRSSILHIEPGEKPQGIHQDVPLYRVNDFRRPDQPEYMLNFFVALTEFREDNGATRLIPRSHKWDGVAPRPTYEQGIPALLQPGDAILLFGSLFHAAGANRSNANRRALAVSMHPCHFTPLESHLHVPREVVETMTPLAQKMIGWRSLDNHNGVPLWMAGDRRMEKVLALKAEEEIEDIRV